MLVAVERSHLSCGTVGILGGQGRKTYWWRLRLACGHRTERRVRYKTAGRRGGWVTRPRDDVADPPKRCRCDECDRESR